MTPGEAEIARLGRRVRDDPRSTAFVALADALRRAGRPGDALQALREGFRVHPDHVAARVVLARVHVDMGHRPLAIEVLADVVQSDPENLAAASLLARLYQEDGRAAEAKPLFERLRLAGHPDAALALAPPSAEAAPGPPPRGADPFDHPRLAERFVAAGHYDRAGRIWRRLLAQHPDAVVPRERLAALERAAAGLGDVDGEPVFSLPTERRPLPGRTEAFAAFCDADDAPLRTRRRSALARYARGFWRWP
jgi:tetratricopeptide (TPR) repeat protein